MLSEDAAKRECLLTSCRFFAPIKGENEADGLPLALHIRVGQVLLLLLIYDVPPGGPFATALSRGVFGFFAILWIMRRI